MREANVDRTERDLLAGFRLRTAAVARNAAWITIVGVAALTAPHHAPGNLGGHAIVWALLGAAALGNLFTYLPLFGQLIQRARRGWPFFAWTFLLLAFDAVMVYVSHDAEHQVYLIYIPVLLFAVATLEPWAAFGALLAAAGGATGATALSGALTTDVVVGSTASFAVVWLLGLYFSQEQRQEMVEAARQRAQAVERGRELEALHERATVLNRELQAAVASVIRAQEHERRRIGRELHDEAVQSLSAATMRLGGLEERLEGRGSAAVREGISDVRDLLINTLWEIRKIIVALRPSDLDDLGLVPALSAYARSRLEEAGVALEMRARRPAPRLAPEVETAVFRIAQEAVNNVARHARAQRALIAIDQLDGALRLRVEDDGAGFDPAGVESNGKGEALGLLGMKERAALLGGTVELRSRPGAGTSVRVTIPLANAGAAS